MDFTKEPAEISMFPLPDTVSFPGKVSMDTFPRTEIQEKYPWILFPEMKYLKSRLLGKFDKETN